MSDLAMTKLCAETMKLPEIDEDGDYYDEEGSSRNFWPLFNDTQAMGLVKKCRLSIEFSHDGWWVFAPEHQLEGQGDDLNRAIVECVAKMQKAKA